MKSSSQEWLAIAFLNYCWVARGGGCLTESISERNDEDGNKIIDWD